jgi:hypothetical protein
MLLAHVPQGQEDLQLKSSRRGSRRRGAGERPCTAVSFPSVDQRFPHRATKNMDIIVELEELKFQGSSR